MYPLPFTASQTYFPFAKLETQDRGHKDNHFRTEDILFVGLCEDVFWTIDIYSPAMDDGEE